MAVPPPSARRVAERILAVSVLATSVACAGGRAPLPAAEGYVISHDGVELFYRTAGAGDPLVVVHGGPGFDHGYLAPDLEPLTESHRVVFYDQRGGGRSTLVSDPGRLDLESHVGDLEAVRQHLGLERMRLLGHSWGAMLAAQYALLHPDMVAKLVMVSPGGVRYDPYEAGLMATITGWMDDATRAELERLEASFKAPGDVRATCRAFFDLLLRGYLYLHDPIGSPPRVRIDLCTGPDDALRNMWLVNMATMRSLGEYDWREDFRALHVPTLLVAGVREIFPVENLHEWRAAFPNASLVLLDGAGHFPYVEQPEAFFEAVLGFLRSELPVDP